MKKKFYALGLAGLTIASMGAAAAMPMFLRDNTEIQNSLNSADYNEFVTTLEQVDPVMASHMSEFRFEKMIEQNDRWEAVESEDYEAWLATFPENSKIAHDEAQFNELVQKQQNHDLIEEALESGDYEAWKAATEEFAYGKGMGDIVTEEDFNNLRQMHEFREAGDFESADALAAELGRDMRMRGEGMHQGNGPGDCSGQEKNGGMKGQGIHRG